MLVTEPTDPAGWPPDTHPPGRSGTTAGPAPGRAADLITLLRPLHAAKSLLLVPLALIDTPVWTVRELAGIAWATLGFTVASAAVYLANDIADRHRDRRHPIKRHRPLASGRVPVLTGILCCGGLLALLGVLVAAGGVERYWPVLAYLPLNLAYTGVLKHIPLIDVGSVALGFVLRVVQGYVALGTRISDWLLVAVLSLSLLLLIGKRRYELLEAGPAHRPALRGYSVELTNQLLPLTGVLAVVAGLIYLATEAPFGPYQHLAVLVSAPFALFALFRYLQLLLVDGEGGDPVRVLLRDRVLVVACLVWFGVLATTLALVHGVRL